MFTLRVLGIVSFTFRIQSLMYARVCSMRMYKICIRRLTMFALYEILSACDNDVGPYALLRHVQCEENHIT